MPDDEENQFCLKIDFQRGAESPNRIFLAMSGLIEACHATDQTLLTTISTRLQPVLLLDDVETASLTSILREQLEGIEDEALKSGEIKKVIGGYLVKAKHKIIAWTKRRDGISDRSELEILGGEIQQLAEETGVKKLECYQPVSMPRLVENLGQFETALSHLGKSDKAYFIAEGPPLEMNKDFHVDVEAVETLLTEQTLTNTINAFLKIKKPDYLGQSMWEMVYDGHSVDVKILDTDWLNDFQNRKKDVRPGDALHVKMRTTVNYGYDGSVVSSHYEALEIIAIKAWNPQVQGKLFLTDVRQDQDDQETR